MSAGGSSIPEENASFFAVHIIDAAGFVFLIGGSIPIIGPIIGGLIAVAVYGLIPW